MSECRVSVRDVRGSAPRRQSDASLTRDSLSVEDSEMCRNAHFVAAYKETQRKRHLPYDQLMTRTHGNGCDLIFNAFLYDHGLGEPKAVGAAAWQKKPNEPIFTYVDAASQLSGGYQNKESHMNTRRAICGCFAAGRLASPSLRSTLHKHKTTL